MEVARVHEFRQGSGLADPHPGHRHDRDRRRRRQHRRDRRARPAARRPAQRRRRSGPGLLRPRRHQADADRRQPGARLSRCRLLPRRRHGARPGGGRGGDPRRRRQAPRARDAARGLGHPRHRQRGRRARLPHPRQRARLRLSLGQHGGVRRLGAAARAGDRPQAQDPARDLPGRRRRHVGARPADQPARLRGGALAAHPRRRHRCRRFRRDVPGAGGRGHVATC